MEGGLIFFLDPHVTQPYVELETWESVSVLWRQAGGYKAAAKRQHEEAEAARRLKEQQDKQEPGTPTDESADRVAQSADHMTETADCEEALSADQKRMRRNNSAAGNLEVVSLIKLNIQI